MSKLLSDEDLWRHVREGNEQALTELFDRYSNRLLSYGHTITSDRELIKDAIQELFLDLWRRRESIGQINQIQRFVLKAFRRLLIRRLKIDGKFTEASAPPKREIAPSPEEEFIEGETSELRQAYLFQKINSLPPRQREIIFLRYYQGMDHQEIGSVMDLKPQGTWNLLSRAIKRLKEIVQDPRYLMISTLMLNNL